MMNINVSIEIPDDAQLASHCPSGQELSDRINYQVFKAIHTNMKMSEQPCVRVTMGESPMICGSCAAPLLPTGACSSRNCDFGRISQRKPSAKKLAATIPGVKLGSTLKKS